MRSKASHFFQFKNLLCGYFISLLGWEISPSQDPYLHRRTQTEKRVHTSISMPGMGFQPTIPMLKRQKTVHALGPSATAIGLHLCYEFIAIISATEIYEGESVNRSQIDIKRKTCDILTWEKHLYLDVSCTNRYTCPIALPVRRNPQDRSILTVVSPTSVPLFQPLRHQQNFCHQGGTPLLDEHFPPQTRNISL
jgi:hypothetical protein